MKEYLITLENYKRKVEIPVIDIFAGPGGLGEGFSVSFNKTDNRYFKIALSIEKDFFAHRTLTLRSFFRQFNKSEIPQDYYEFVKGKITLEKLFEKWPIEAEKAKEEAWFAELGEGPKATHYKTVDEKIRKALDGKKNWLLIGGPPCQAYSVVGRSRRKQKVLDEKTDERVDLYKQYLRILAVHSPSGFVMENVKGILSAKTEKNTVFSKILSDLSNPEESYYSEFGKNGVRINCPGYKIYSLTKEPDSYNCEGMPLYNPGDFIVYSEKYGIPQCRHRMIIIGIRKDIQLIPELIIEQDEVPISKVLKGLPELRSALSKTENSITNWHKVLAGILSPNVINEIDGDIRKEITKQLETIKKLNNETGNDYLQFKSCIDYNNNWYLDERLEGVCNHSSRGHMDSDILRYFFASCFAKVKGLSPKLEDFPEQLLPLHKNIKEGVENKKFADRFRVQLIDAPAKTITSHIAKDGHYYIHPVPAQCRSLTVREAARIQTFPDNYFFCGPRTEQYKQVGNAVPPLLAKQIADIVLKTLFQNKKIK